MLHLQAKEKSIGEMKPFYNLGYSESFLSYFRPAASKFRHLTILLSFFVIAALLSSLLLIYQYRILIIMLLFGLGVASMMHMRFANWLGAFDINMIITVYVSMAFGFPAGFFVSHAEILGLILVGDIDNNLLYDLSASYMVAIIASLFTIANFVPVVTVLVIMYCIAGLAYHSFSGTLHFANCSWYITNFAWVIFLVYKMLPLVFSI